MKQNQVYGSKNFTRQSTPLLGSPNMNDCQESLYTMRLFINGRVQIMMWSLSSKHVVIRLQTRENISYSTLSSEEFHPM